MRWHKSGAKTEVDLNTSQSKPIEPVTGIIEGIAMAIEACPKHKHIRLSRQKYRFISSEIASIACSSSLQTITPCQIVSLDWLKA